MYVNVQESNRSRNKGFLHSLSRYYRHQTPVAKLATQVLKYLIKRMAFEGKNSVQFGPHSLGYGDIQSILREANH